MAKIVRFMFTSPMEYKKERENLSGDFQQSAENLLPLPIFYLIHLILYHTISNPDFRKNVLRLCRIFFDLTPDMSHIDAENAVVSVCVGPPDILDNGVVGHDAAGVFGQQSDNFKFVLGQMSFLTAHSNQMLVEIYDQILGLERPFVQK